MRWHDPRFQLARTLSYRGGTGVSLTGWEEHEVYRAAASRATRMSCVGEWLLGMHRPVGSCRAHYVEWKVREEVRMAVRAVSPPLRKRPLAPNRARGSVGPCPPASRSSCHVLRIHVPSISSYSTAHEAMSPHHHHYNRQASKMLDGDGLHTDLTSLETSGAIQFVLADTKRRTIQSTRQRNTCRLRLINSLVINLESRT